LLETSKTYQCLLGNNLKDETMDNQQPSISGFEFGWFCGIIDGEGCLGLWHKGRRDYTVGLRMTNTSKDIIDAFTNVLDRLNIPYYVGHSKPRKETQKEYWTVVVEGFKRLGKLLPIIKDSLVCKKKQANLLAEWIDSRSAKWHRAEYSARELQIKESVSALNYRGVQK
jgi:hypothetical protein